MTINKTIGSIFLVSGTAIGAGILALPITMARLGLLTSFVLMMIIWLAMYYSALINIELNLRVGKGQPLGKLGSLISGKKASFIGDTSLIILCYALLSAYIYGGGSTLSAIIADISNNNIKISSLESIILFLALLIQILRFPIEKVTYINNILFVLMLTAIAVFIACLFYKIDLNNLPISTPFEIQSWYIAVPVLFTSFGFQVVFHTLTSYCDKNVKQLKTVFFWGSLIPAILYTIWIVVTLGALYNGNHDFYLKLISNESVELSVFINALSQIANINILQYLSLLISFLVILTSAIGVGLGLVDIIKSKLNITNAQYLNKIKGTNIVIACLVVMPSSMIAMIVPNAFIYALSFAGMILAFIAILIPLYLYYKSNGLGQFYKITQYKSIHLFLLVIACFVIICELMNYL